MMRDGWHLPSKHSAVCTSDWMLAVRNLQVFCPSKKENFTIKKSFAPPPREVLMKKLEQAVVELEATGNIPEEEVPKIHRLIGTLRLRTANQEWYMIALSFFNPDDEIFGKSYKYQRERDVPLEPVIGNDDGLFTDLPLLSEREVRKTNRMRMPKEMTL